MSARILIIEDNPTNMELMDYLLQAFGHQTLHAVDGEQGVDSAQRLIPDLIICDVHLPKLDGYGVIRHLKNNPSLKSIPVIAVTALAMVGDREKLISAGFDSYLAKPIDPEFFVDQIEKFLPSQLSSSNPSVTASDTTGNSGAANSSIDSSNGA